MFLRLLQPDKRRIAIAALLFGLCTYSLLLAWYSRYGGELVLQQLRSSITRSVNEGQLSNFNDTLHRQGYVISLEFAGQLMAGLRAIVSLQCWLASFSLPMVVVEPYVLDSRLRHNSTIWKQVEAAMNTNGKTQPLAISEYINMGTYNHMSKREGRPPLVGLKELWQEAPRKLIVVTIGGQSKMECLRYARAELCESKESGRDKKDYSTSECSPLHRVRSTVRYLERIKGFKVVRNICINCDRNPLMYFTPNELTKHIFGEYSPSEVTLVMSHWKFAYELSPGCIPCQDQVVSPLTLFSPHPQLVKYANAYISALRVNPQAKVIAVMIRTEWFLIRHMQESLETVIATFRNCLSSILNKHGQLSGSHQLTRTVLALDIGRYGSGSFSQTFEITNITKGLYSAVVNEVKLFVSQLNLDYDDWEESLGVVVQNKTNDCGYVAMLQNVIASKADYIIRVGGGYYQRLAVQLFTNNHPDEARDGCQRVKEVCVTSTNSIKSAQCTPDSTQ